jgi:hypothetical protein
MVPAPRADRSVRLHGLRHDQALDPGASFRPTGALRATRRSRRPRARPTTGCRHNRGPPSPHCRVAAQGHSRVRPSAHSPRASETQGTPPLIASIQRHWDRVAALRPNSTRFQGISDTGFVLAFPLASELASRVLDSGSTAKIKLRRSVACFTSRRATRLRRNARLVVAVEGASGRLAHRRAHPRSGVRDVSLRTLEPPVGHSGLRMPSRSYASGGIASSDL